mmetsp:Transcript_26277/g.42247  ORF Transcript_26277/g.42247 Transcript_26277/m.42247 type:complete len:90 (-) Transcript_26277:729-998(-)
MNMTILHALPNMFFLLMGGGDTIFVLSAYQSKSTVWLITGICATPLLSLQLDLPGRISSRHESHRYLHGIQQDPELKHAPSRAAVFAVC